MKRQKTLCVLLAVLMLLSLLAGCGTGEESNKAATAEQSSDTRKAPEGSTAAAPRGDRPAGTPDGTVPEAPPDGTGGPGGNPPGPPPDGNGGPGGNPPGPPPDGNSGPGGPGAGTEIDYTGATVIRSAETQSGKRYESSTADESALLIETNDAVTVKDPTVTKTGDSDGRDSCSFYGLNAAVLVKDGAAASITGGTIRSDAEGANAVFCYGGNGGRNGAEGDGTTLVIRDTRIRTTGGGSGGVMTTGGGVTYVYDLAYMLERLYHKTHIADGCGYIFDSAHIVGKDCGGNNRKRGVFGAAYGHFTPEGLTAVDNEFLQGAIPLSSIYHKKPPRRFRKKVCTYKESITYKKSFEKTLKKVFLKKTKKCKGILLYVK
jgi:hypothetical protein